MNGWRVFEVFFFVKFSVNCLQWSVEQNEYSKSDAITKENETSAIFVFDFLIWFFFWRMGGSKMCFWQRKCSTDWLYGSLFGAGEVEIQQANQCDHVFSSHVKSISTLTFTESQTTICCFQTMRKSMSATHSVYYIVTIWLWMTDKFFVVDCVFVVHPYEYVSPGIAWDARVICSVALCLRVSVCEWLFP